MPRYLATVISPIHIGNGEQYEENYNLLQKSGYVYIYDEFKIGEFLFKNKALTAANASDFKSLVRKHREEIIASNIHIRKISTGLMVNKPLYANVSTQNTPFISGSSVKGALRTAVIDSLKNTPEKSQKALAELEDKQITAQRFERNGNSIEAFDKDFINIFKFLKVTDSTGELKTKIYKTINIKKNKEHQEDRASRVEKIESFVECIEPKQTFEINIDDAGDKGIFDTLGIMCNAYNIPNYKIDSAYYFKALSKITQETANKLSKLGNGMFLLNVGKFGGAEQKSINGLRNIKLVKESDKTQTTARTFALEKMAQNETFFEKELLPFGWLLIEAIA